MLTQLSSPGCPIHEIEKSISEGKPYLFEIKNCLMSFKNAFHKSFLVLIHLHLNSAKYDESTVFFLTTVRR